MKLENLTNDELMIMYKQGNPEIAYQAFEVLYKKSSPPLYSYLLKKCKHAEEAQDLLQKTYLKIHQCRELYSSKYKFEQWLYCIAKNIMNDEWRKQTREKNKLTSAALQNSAPPENERIDLNISSTDLELLELKYIDELSYKEISQILNKSETSLRKFTSRLIMKIKAGAV